jgi:alkanesulfonate monooxygenase SsuD/methylene tetrahydromethanopterin reductase-like flavin-dependent oxidoreductase (luciferase family)
MAAMQVGVQFFPDVRPEDKSPAAYYRDCLEIVERAEPLGYTHVRIVEHYFHYYGGYSPNPFVFLAAAAQRTKTARLVTGACIPAFNNPLKLAAEIAELDGISNGRVDVGFARAFLPHEFRTFGISPDESVARYREGIEQVDLLLREEHATHRGQFHAFENVTSLPRPTQLPRPKFYVAATFTRETFEYAGRMGYAIMAIPMASDKLRETLDVYRAAYRAAGHPGNGEVMLALHMFVDEDGERARRIARPQLDAYFASLLEAANDWTTGTSSSDYKDYDKKYERLSQQTMESLIASGSALIGTPAEALASLTALNERIGGFECASLQVNFHCCRRPRRYGRSSCSGGKCSRTLVNSAWARRFSGPRHSDGRTRRDPFRTYRARGSIRLRLHARLGHAPWLSLRLPRSGPGKQRP